ncbi:MAG: FAD-dependent oxidoreductase [Planctomycetes bacterium]|nr:FAD-dependent oxidoreductase [Planctomycetota bacterium]
MQKRIARRVFLASGTAAAATLAAGSVRSALPGEPTLEKAYREPAREIPVVEHDDVIVCGAGPAGVAAAIAAARAGAKTRLLEVGGCLGGVWTAGLLSWILDAANKTGLMREMLDELSRRGASAKYGSSIGYDVELMKLMLERMCIDAGVKVRLHTRVVAAARDESGRLGLAVTESKSGRQAWSADLFVDATGDGDLAARAGCGFDYGRPQSDEAQPLSMIVLLVGIRPEEMAPFVRGLAEPGGERNPKGRLLEEMRRAGVDPSYARPTLFYIREGLFCMMANHEYGVSATDACAITEATMRARAEVHQLVDGLRRLGGVWQNVQIVATPEHIGVREGRRIHGLYEVTREDLIEGKQHDDAVCRVTFGVDVHSTNPGKDKGIMKEGVRARPYDIPYRALIARDVDALLMAGRCISGDFIAHSSYRVTGNAVAMGEAAGTAAAIAARTRRLPQQVPWAEINRAVQTAQETEPPKG